MLRRNSANLTANLAPDLSQSLYELPPSHPACVREQLPHSTSSIVTSHVHQRPAALGSDPGGDSHV